MTLLSFGFAVIVVARVHCHKLLVARKFLYYSLELSVCVCASVCLCVFQLIAQSVNEGTQNLSEFEFNNK